MTAAPTRFALHDGAPRDFAPAACHRVPIGPEISLVFESRQSLWFRLAELSAATRMAPDENGQSGLYDRLLPQAGTLRAAVWLGGGRRSPRSWAALRHYRDAVRRGRIAFEDATGRVVLGSFGRDRVDERLVGLVGWVEFPFDADDIAAFATPGRGWHLSATVEEQRNISETLSDATWHALQADLR